MTKKSSASKTQVTIKGNITAGHDVVFGDQYNQQVSQIASPQEFIAKLQELQGQITQIKKQPDLLPEQKETLEIVEGNVNQVIDEAQKPEPKSSRIVATLNAAKAVMDSLGDGVKSAIGLSTVIAGFGQIALKLFGG